MKQSENHSPKGLDTFITSFTCLLVGKTATHGTLTLFQDYLCFVFATGQIDESTKLQYLDITDITVESRFANAIANLEIHTEEQTFVYSGFHQAQNARSLIFLIRDQLKEQTETYGFAPNSDNSVKWTDLANPTLLCSILIPAPIDQVMNLFEKKDFLSAFYQECGNEDIEITDWKEYDGYKERILDYRKCVIVPVFGKTLIKVSETQKLFELDGSFGVCVTSDLGKTPYADCFDPIVQQLYVDHGDKVELIVNQELIWSSEPFVKGIILSTTTAEVKDQYLKYSKKMIEAVGGSTDSMSESEQMTAEDSFTSTRKIYKIAIWVLLVVLAISVSIRNWPQYHYPGSKVMQVCRIFVSIIFFLLLIFF